VCVCAKTVPSTHPASAGSFPDAATFVLLFFFFLPQPSPREQWASMLKPVRHSADAHCWRCSLATQGIEHTRRLHKRLRKRGPTIRRVRTSARQLHRTGLAHLRQLQRTGLAPPRSALPPAPRPSHPPAVLGPGTRAEKGGEPGGDEAVFSCALRLKRTWRCPRWASSVSVRHRSRSPLRSLPSDFVDLYWKIRTPISLGGQKLDPREKTMQEPLAKIAEGRERLKHFWAAEGAAFREVWASLSQVPGGCGGSVSRIHSRTGLGFLSRMHMYTRAHAHPLAHVYSVSRIHSRTCLGF